jgi:membrane-bound lytic murein transglycosylase A
MRVLCLAAVLVMALTMTATAKPSLSPVRFADLQGWAEDDHAAALAAFRRSCAEIMEEGHAFKRPVSYGGARDDWIPVCRMAESAGDARAFFESHFTPLQVNDPERPEGLFTGYYEPEALGSREQGGEYQVPVYRKPHDLTVLPGADGDVGGLKYGRLVDGKPQPYFTRKEIEQGALKGRGLEIAYLKDWADAFFIHVQGSGRIRLPDASAIRLAYAAKSGQPYTGIGGVLVERGVLTKDNMSMQALRSWMKSNPQAARELMWENKSFVFFREVEVTDPDLGAPGAAKVLLTPLRSLAVDRRFWIFGTPVWLDTRAPSGPNQQLEVFRHLMIAQDTGSAIKGHVRGDVYWGWGEKAELTAGHMKSPGRMTVLLPKSLAARLVAAQ